MCLGRLLASHDVALILIGLLAVASMLGGTLPQTARLSPQVQQGFQTDWSGISSWLEMLGLSNLFGSEWFAILYTALLINLVAGVAYSIARRYAWYRGRVPPRFQLQGKGHLPLQLPVPFGTLSPSGRQSRGMFGLWGTPLFHGGIAVIVLGGIWSASVGFGAHLELSVGETYRGQQKKLVMDRGDSMPAGLDAVLHLDGIDVEVSQQKRLQTLRARFSYRREGGAIERSTVRTNHPLKLGIYELSPDNTGGYSAVFDRIRLDGERRRMYLHFNVPLGDWNWNGSWKVARDILVELDGTPLFYQMVLEGREPQSLQLVVKQGVNTIFSGELHPGMEADLGAYRLRYVGAVPWLGFYLASDYPRYLVFAGFAITLAGFLLHLLLHPRRLEVVQEGERWAVRVWAMPGDWRLDERWKQWSSHLPAGESS